MNTSKIKGLMVEKGLTQRELAEQIGISLAALNRKLQTGDFNVGEIEAIGNALGLSNKEKTALFFG